MFPPNTRRGRLDVAALTARASAPRRGFQIGPKIRVGGTLGKLGQGLKEGVGKAAKLAAPIASFINPGLGAALSAGGHILDTSDGGIHANNVGSLALNTAMTAGGGKLLSKVPGVSSVTNKIGDLASSLLSHVPQGVKGVVSGGGADGKGSFGAVGDMAGKLMPGGAPGTGGKGGFDPSEIIKLLGLAGAGVAGVQGYQAAQKASAAQDAALQRNVAISQAQADQGNAILAGAKPIREAAEKGMLAKLTAGAPAPADLSGFADTANPFRKKYGPKVPPPPGVV